MLHWINAARAEHVPPAVRPGSVLVDVACGGGLLAPHVAAKGHRHVGVELSPTASALARAHGVDVVRGDAQRLPLADACADVVVAGEVLEHVPDLAAAVSEACRVLRPGGTLVLDTIAATWFGRFSSITVGERVPGGPPRRLHDPDLYVDRAELVRLADAGGVRLALAGLRPSLVDYVGWVAGRRADVRMLQDEVDGGAVPGGRGEAVSAPLTAAVVGSGSAFPPPMGQQHLWDGFFKEHYNDARLARKVWEHSAITTRRGVVDPAREDISSWGTAARMRRFVQEAMPLGKEAVGAALADAGLAPSDVGQFTVVSCTGYATPGLDVLLARDLGMSDTVQRLHVGHMGCYAALPGLAATADFVAARQRPAVMLCLELTSLHVQPTTETARSGSPTPEDLQQMVAHALFSDAAAAVVLEPSAQASRPGFEVVDVVARTDASTAGHMTWDVTDLGFKMGLSPAVPDVLARYARPVVEDLLGRHGLAVQDVAGWAVHPGGRKIVEVVGEALDLPEERLQASYDVLRDVGNCSSATVLLVLDRLLEVQDVPPGGTVVAMAFGPGLTLYAALLRRTG